MSDQSAVAREIALKLVGTSTNEALENSFAKPLRDAIAAALDQATARARQAGRHEGMVDAARIADEYHTARGAVEAIRAALPVSAQPEEG